jgi:hypothetical protein
VSAPTRITGDRLVYAAIAVETILDRADLPRDLYQLRMGHDGALRVLFGPGLFDAGAPVPGAGARARQAVKVLNTLRPGLVQVEGPTVRVHRAVLEFAIYSCGLTSVEIAAEYLAYQRRAVRFAAPRVVRRAADSARAA